MVCNGDMHYKLNANTKKGVYLVCQPFIWCIAYYEKHYTHSILFLIMEPIGKKGIEMYM